MPVSVRQQAAESFARLGYPTTKDEEWRFTNLKPLTSIAFERATPVGSGFKPAAGLRPALLFVNGYYVEGANGAIDDQHLARYADFRTHAFVAQNTANFADAAVVRVPAGTIVEEPIHIVHVSTGTERPQVSYPRNLIVLEPHSQASIVETYIGDSGVYFSNAVTEIVAGEEAVVDHYKLQMESRDAFHIATVQVEQGRGSSFRSHSFSFGAALARTEINTRLAEGSDCALNGLYAVSGTQHVDSRTSIDHTQPHGTSRELYKGILNGRSAAVFNGRIIVRKDAQKTDAKQTNKNLVLSEGSTINTKPELQIYADDVRCTHGATIGQLDKESLFYLQSRGIGADQAREMLIAAFAREIVDQIKVEALRSYVEQALEVR